MHREDCRRTEDPFHTSHKGREKQKVPYWTRVAKRRRRTQLAKQHKRIMAEIERRKLLAAARAKSGVGSAGEPPRVR